MRNILFRGFHKDESGKEKVYVKGEWIKGYWVVGLPYRNPADSEKINCIQLEDYYENDFGHIIGHYEKVIPETVGQYTGLKDKNGKKIFEGDIVEYSDKDYCYYDEEAIIFKGQIKCEVGAFGIVTLDCLPDFGYSSYCANDNFISLWEIYWNENENEDCINSIEIIGNIHSNFELLEV